MTLLKGEIARGSFDTITLGLTAPTDLNSLMEYNPENDDPTLIGAATFFHELSHYLQFYGTSFGYFYLLQIRGIAAAMNEYMQAAKTSTEVINSFPACNWPIDFRDVFLGEKDRLFYTQSMLMNRYCNEELFGFTYAHFGNNHPIPINGQHVLSSPLFLRNDELNRDFPVTGDILLENYATCQEMQFVISNTSRDRALNFMSKMYEDLSVDQKLRYMGIAVWIGTFGLTHIEPLLYFTLLNQPQNGFLKRIGDYSLVRNTKQLLTNFSELQHIKKPETNEEMVTSLAAIARISGLDNPLDILAQNLSLIAPELEKKDPWSIDWIAAKIWAFFLNEPLQIIKWPSNPASILKSIPIMKLHFSNIQQEYSTMNYVNSKELQNEIEFTKKHHKYTERLHFIIGLYNNKEVKCPFFFSVKPELCSFCNICNGFLPNSEIGDDCPVVSEHSDILKLVYNKS
ncbi:MAG: hypothetical protein WC602_01775 [archaeon]